MLTAHLLFSIFRVLGTEKISRIVAVDNNSTDGSRELLTHFANRGMLDLISNKKQNYHGPAINQAMSYLTKMHRRGKCNQTRYVWIIDSDVILMRSDVIDDAVHFLNERGAAAIGQLQYDALPPEGYAHISSLLIDPRKAWARHIAPFDNTGAPAANFQQSLRAHGFEIGDFPYRSDHYLLHLTRGTLKSIKDQDDRENQYYQWAKSHSAHHYHGNAHGQEIHEEFLKIFHTQVPSMTPEALVEACNKPDRIKIPLPTSRHANTEIENK